MRVFEYLKFSISTDAESQILASSNTPFNKINKKAPFLGINRERALFRYEIQVNYCCTPKSAIVPFRSERQQQQQHAGWVAGKKFISVLDGQTYSQKQQVPSHV